MSKEMSKEMSKSMEEALRISREYEENQGPISVARSYPGTIVTERMTAYGEEVKDECSNGMCTISGGRRRRSRRHRKSRKSRRHRKTRRNHRSRRYRR
jgi:hypothetical protein